MAFTLPEHERRARQNRYDASAYRHITLTEDLRTVAQAESSLSSQTETSCLMLLFRLWRQWKVLLHKMIVSDFVVPVLVSYIGGH